jgi:hypothetical protein
MGRCSHIPTAVTVRGSYLRRVFNQWFTTGNGTNVREFLFWLLLSLATFRTTTRLDVFLFLLWSRILPDYWAIRFL